MAEEAALDLLRRLAGDFQCEERPEAITRSRSASSPPAGRHGEPGEGRPEGDVARQMLARSPEPGEERG